jgi:hypothetical protein
MARLDHATRGSFLRELLACLALIAALGAWGLSVRRNAQTDVHLQRMSLPAARAQAQDRLVGTVVDVAALSGGMERRGDGNVPHRPAIVWLLDLDRCSGCFDSVGEWTRLERLDDHDALLILIGDRTPAVDARLRALRRTEVRWTDRERVHDQLGPVLANTRLLLDEDGIALLVDSRAVGQDCGWSFEAQVGALKGLNSAWAIRQSAVRRPIANGAQP